jgi:hypothetical protein
MSFLDTSVTGILIGGALGYLGVSAYNTMRGGAISFVNPMTYIALLKSDMVASSIPLVLGWVGYSYFGEGNMAYLGGVAGGALGQALAPTLRSS